MCEMGTRLDVGGDVRWGHGGGKGKKFKSKVSMYKIS